MTLNSIYNDLNSLLSRFECPWHRVVDTRYKFNCQYFTSIELFKAEYTITITNEYAPEKYSSKMHTGFTFAAADSSARCVVPPKPVIWRVSKNMKRLSVSTWSRNKPDKILCTKGQRHTKGQRRIQPQHRDNMPPGNKIISCKFILIAGSAPTSPVCCLHSRPSFLEALHIDQQKPQMLTKSNENVSQDITLLHKT